MLRYSRAALIMAIPKGLYRACISKGERMCRKALQSALGKWCVTQGNVSWLLRLHMVGMRIKREHVNAVRCAEYMTCRMHGNSRHPWFSALICLG